MASVSLVSPGTTTTFAAADKGRDDSFSSYLNLIKESLSQDLAPNSGPIPAAMRISIGPKRSEDGEIDIFAAEKYFSGVIDADNAKLALRNSYSKERTASLKSRSATDSSCSEASSNSRNVLLRDLRRKSPPNGRKNVRCRRLLGVFWCSCSTKADKDVGAATGAGRDGMASRNWKKAVEFEDVSLIFSSLNQKRTVQMETIEGFPTTSFASSSPFIQKNIATGSSSIKSSAFLAPEIGGDGAKDEETDLRSEASSDLFEIDCLSINGHAAAVFVPEPAYEPSEASIEWSVATASAAAVVEETKKPAKSHKAGMLLGCGSNKAVDVTTDVYKKPERAVSGRFEQLPAVARYHASHAIQRR